MSTKQSIALVIGAAISALIMSPVFAAGNPTPGVYKAPVNSYGQPDLEGTWTNATLTVLERPKEYGARLVMTPEEVNSKLIGVPAGTVRRLTLAMSACTTCSIQTIDTPLCSMSRTSAISARHSCSVNPPATSSSSSTAGSDAKARASSSRLRSSSVRLDAGRLAFPASPQRCKIAMQLS